jgi:ArsR family transcriptional regulator
MAKYQKNLVDSSEIFKALSHPARLCVVNKLTTTSLIVGQMQECLGMSQSNVSQHLSILKSKGIIKSERIGSVLFACRRKDERACENISG